MNEREWRRALRAALVSIESLQIEAMRRSPQGGAWTLHAGILFAAGAGLELALKLGYPGGTQDTADVVTGVTAEPVSLSRRAVCPASRREVVGLVRGSSSIVKVRCSDCDALLTVTAEGLIPRHYLKDRRA